MGRLDQDHDSQVASPQASTSLVVLWWRGAILAFYLYGIVIIVGGGFQMLMTVEKAIFGDQVRVAIRALLAGAFFFLFVPLVCYGFGMFCHQQFSKWQSRDTQALPPASSTASQDGRDDL